MRRYFCDICDTSLTPTTLYVDHLDFFNSNLDLCNSCFKKFKGAKAEIYDTYETSYNELKENYIDDLKDIILDTSEGTGHNPVTPNPEYDDIDLPNT